MNKNKRPYFRHIVIELECPFEQANSLVWIKKTIGILIEKIEIRTLKTMYHLFKPQGISLLYIISSSHLSIHTWPENNYIHIELLTCSRTQKLDKLSVIIEEVFPKLPYKISELNY